MAQSKLSAIFLAILACFLWASAVVPIKIGLQYADPFHFAGVRFMLAGLILAPLWLRKGFSIGMFRENGRTILLLSLFQTFLLYGLFHVGMTMVPAALAAIMMGVAPLLAAIMAHFFMADEPMSLAKAFSLIVGIAGVIVVSVSRLPMAAEGNYTEFIGVMILLLANIAGIVGNIVVAKEKKAADPIFLTSTQIFIGGLSLYLVSLVVEPPSTRILPFEYYLILVSLAALSAIAFSIWFSLLKRKDVKVSDLNLWKFIIPVFGAIFSWVLLPGESPQLMTVVGMLCIGCSIISYNLFMSRQVRANGSDHVQAVEESS